MLIESPRLRPEDRAAWEEASARDLAWASTSRYRARVEEAELAVVRFARDGRCYAGVSWGKDSTVLADLVARLALAIPLVHIRVNPIHNPDCDAVRDTFLLRYPEHQYGEVLIRCAVDDDGRVHATGTLESGFRLAENLYGARHLSGLRRNESGERERYFRLYGLSTDRVCCPLIRWSAEDVFAYLAVRDLPIHPAYAMTFGGALDRRRNRVSSLGGKRGRGTGRLEWERAYYPEMIDD